MAKVVCFVLLSILVSQVCSIRWLVIANGTSRPMGDEPTMQTARLLKQRRMRTRDYHVAQNHGEVSVWSFMSLCQHTNHILEDRLVVESLLIPKLKQPRPHSLTAILKQNEQMQ